MHQTTNPEIKTKVVTSWTIQLRGTKLLPRRRLVFRIDQIGRNKAGDLVLKRDGKVVATFNREQVIGAWKTTIKTTKAPNKPKLKKKEPTEIQEIA